MLPRLRNVVSAFVNWLEIKFPVVIPPGTDPNPDTVGQLAHFFTGMALFFALLNFVPADTTMYLVTTFAASKEAAEASGISGRLGKLSWEGKQPWFEPWSRSSARDFMYFMYGQWTALGILIVALQVGR